MTQTTMFEKNFVTRNARVQLKVVDMEEATDLTSGEKSSDIINQGIGPNPMENTDTNTDRDVTGSQLILAARVFSPRLSLIKK